MRQQVGPAVSELAHLPHRGLVLVLGYLPAPRVALRLAVKLGDEDPVSLRSLIEHAFEYFRISAVGNYSLRFAAMGILGPGMP